MPKNGKYSDEERALIDGYINTSAHATEAVTTNVRLWAEPKTPLPLAEGNDIAFEGKALIQRADRRAEYEIHPTFPIDGAMVGKLKLWSIDEGFAEMLTGTVRALKPQVVLETGTNWGRSARAIAEGLCQNGEGHLYTVDMIDHEIHSSGALKEKHKPYVTQILGKTPDVFASDPTLANLNGIDLAFLDGEHTAKGVEEDLEYVEAHRADECVVLVDNTRDGQWPEAEEFFNNYTKYPCINLKTMCGTAMIVMK